MSQQSGRGYPAAMLKTAIAVISPHEHAIVPCHQYLGTCCVPIGVDMASNLTIEHFLCLAQRRKMQINYVTKQGRLMTDNRATIADKPTTASTDSRVQQAAYTTTCTTCNPRQTRGRRHYGWDRGLVGIPIRLRALVTVLYTCTYDVLS